MIRYNAITLSILIFSTSIVNSTDHTLDSCERDSTLVAFKVPDANHDEVSILSQSSSNITRSTSEQPQFPQHVFWGKGFEDLMQSYSCLEPIHVNSVDSDEEDEHDDDEICSVTPKFSTSIPGISAAQLSLLSVKTGRRTTVLSEAEKRKQQLSMLSLEMQGRRKDSVEIGNSLTSYLSPDVAAVLPRERYSAAPYPVLNSIGFHPSHSVHEKAYRYIALCNAITNAYVVREADVTKWVQRVWKEMDSARREGYFRVQERRRYTHIARNEKVQPKIFLENLLRIKREKNQAGFAELSTAHYILDASRQEYKPIPSMKNEDVGHWLNMINLAQSADDSYEGPRSAEGVLMLMKERYAALFEEQEAWNNQKQDHIRYFSEEAAKALLEAQEQSEAVAKAALQNNPVLSTLIAENPGIAHVFESSYLLHPAFGLITARIPLESLMADVEQERHASTRVTKRALIDFTGDPNLRQALTENANLEDEIHRFVKGNYDLRRLMQDGSEVEINLAHYMPNLIRSVLIQLGSEDSEFNTTLEDMLVALEANWYDAPVHLFTRERLIDAQNPPHPVLKEWADATMTGLPEFNRDRHSNVNEMLTSVRELIYYVAQQLNEARTHNAAFQNELIQFKKTHTDVMRLLKDPDTLHKAGEYLLVENFFSHIRYSANAQEYPLNVLPLLIQHRLYVESERQQQFVDRAEVGQYAMQTKALDVKGYPQLQNWFNEADDVRPVVQLVWDLAKYDVLKRQLSAPWKDLISSPVERVKFVSVLQKIVRSYSPKGVAAEAQLYVDGEGVTGPNPVIDFFVEIPGLASVLLPELSDEERNDQRFCPYGDNNFELQKRGDLTFEALLRSPLIALSVNEDSNPSAINSYIDSAYFFYAAAMRDSEYERKISNLKNARQLLKNQARNTLKKLPLQQQGAYERQIEDRLQQVRIQKAKAFLAHHGQL